MLVEFPFGAVDRSTIFGPPEMRQRAALIGLNDRLIGQIERRFAHMDLIEARQLAAVHGAQRPGHRAGANLAAVTEGRRHILGGRLVNFGI